jgi:cell division protein FtsW
MREGSGEVTRLGASGTYDLDLVLITIVLVAIGLIMIASSGQMVVLGKKAGGPHFVLFYRQVLFAALGACFLIICMKLPYRLYERYALHVLVAGFLLLAAVLVIGTEVRHARRWISLGGIDFQPVEAAKLSLVVFLAAKISAWGERVRDFKRGFVPLVGVGFLMAAMLVFQPNYSNAGFIIVLTLIMLFIGGCKLRHIMVLAVPFAVAAPFLLKVPKIMSRLTVLLGGAHMEPWAGYQRNQSLIALGSGALFGCGPGRGHQKFRFLPDAHTDFIYSIIGEELGLIGTLVILFLFVLLLRRAARTARRAPDTFGYLLAMGLGLMVFMTAIINISMTVGLLPTAGLPLPFVSYGGSCLVASMAAVGILVNVSFEGKEKKLPSEFIAAKRTGKLTYARRGR